MVRQILRDDHGASTVEYGLIVFAIAATVVAAAVGLGGVVDGTYSDSCSVLETTRKAHDTNAAAAC
ncbi:MAG: Flp family type IVb pilin [Actinomycetes bacterium]